MLTLLMYVKVNITVVRFLGIGKASRGGQPSWRGLLCNPAGEGLCVVNTLYRTCIWLCRAGSKPAVLLLKIIVY